METGSVADSDAGSQPRWLTPAERAVWLRLLALTVQLPGALDAQLLRDSGLTLFEYVVLAGLSEQPDRTLRMSQLAKVARGSLSRLSHVASKLERKGLLARQPCPGDGRHTNAVLTDAGFACISEAAPRHVETARDLVLDQLSGAQLQALGEAAQAILERIDPGAAYPPFTN